MTRHASITVRVTVDTLDDGLIIECGTQTIAGSQYAIVNADAAVTCGAESLRQLSELLASPEAQRRLAATVRRLS